MTQGSETKVSSFDEWLRNPNRKKISDVTYKKVFEAGAAYRQDEVSKLQTEIDDSENTRAVLYRENMDLRESNIELQKRIGEALVQISNHYHSCVARKNLKRMSASISEVAEIEAHESNMCVLYNILKGESNE